MAKKKSKFYSKDMNVKPKKRSPSKQKPTQFAEPTRSAKKKA